MRHVLFAIFDTEHEAQNCLRELQELPNVTVLLHRDKVSRNDSEIEETGAREGIVTGALMGTIVGGALGAILAGPIDLVPVDWLTGALFGMLGGAGAGALGGGLMGAGQPDPALKGVEKEVQNGKVVLTIEPHSTAEIADIERLCRAHDGRIVRKPFIGFWTHRLRSRRRARMTL